eukprot:COSAG01_NODE_37487_length_503_cov_0.509901_1_plen_102_part_10
MPIIQLPQMEREDGLISPLSVDTFEDLAVEVERALKRQRQPVATASQAARVRDDAGDTPSNPGRSWVSRGAIAGGDATDVSLMLGAGFMRARRHAKAQAEEA